MRDPQRLLDTPASDLELRLLRAGAAEQPPPAALGRLAHALGVRLTESAPSAALHLPPTAAAATSTTKLSLFALGAVTLGLAATGVVWFTTRSPAPQGAEVPQAAHAFPERPAPAAAERSAQPAPGADSLSREIAFIDSVRKLLDTDRAPAALSSLQRYERDFPRAVLQQEADLLSIEAHLRAGQQPRARALATRFLQRHPDSPHSARVRELIDAAAR